MENNMEQTATVEQVSTTVQTDTEESTETAVSADTEESTETTVPADTEESTEPTVSADTEESTETTASADTEESTETAVSAELLYQRAMEEYATFTPSTRRAIQNTLKIMNGKYGGGFYIKYVMDCGSCYGWLNLVIVYPDGDYKSLILYKNYLRETDTDSSNGIYTPQEGMPKKSIKGFRDWEADERLEHYLSLEHYETPQMPIPTGGIWKLIIEHYEEIPISKINQTASLDQLVADLQAWALEESNKQGQGFMYDDGKCYIEPEDFREIVESDGWNISQARTALDMQGYFVKDPSTKGYQKTKRIGGTTKRFYVIRCDAVVPEELPKFIGDPTYKFLYKTGAELKIERLEKENEDMWYQYNKLAGEVGRELIL